MIEQSPGDNGTVPFRVDMFRNKFFHPAVGVLRSFLFWFAYGQDIEHDRCNQSDQEMETGFAVSHSGTSFRLTLSPVPAVFLPVLPSPPQSDK